MNTTATPALFPQPFNGNGCMLAVQLPQPAGRNRRAPLLCKNPHQTSGTKAHLKASIVQGLPELRRGDFDDAH